MFLQTELNAAYEELYMITSAVREVKEYEGDYDNLANFTLSHRQWLISRQRMTAIPLASVKFLRRPHHRSAGHWRLDATVTYTPDEDEQCENLEKRAVSIAGLTGTPALCRQRAHRHRRLMPNVAGFSVCRCPAYGRGVRRVDVQPAGEFRS